jgi:GTP-binding protein
VVVLVVDGTQGKFNKIDLQLANKCLTEGRALVICANKRDIVMGAGISSKHYEQGIVLHCRQYMKEFGEVKVVSCSASEQDGVNDVLDAVLETHDSWSKRVSTWVLNRWIKDALLSLNAPREGGKTITVKYITQVKSRPPTFALFCNAEKIPGSFERFLR